MIGVRVTKQALATTLQRSEEASDRVMTSLAAGLRRAVEDVATDRPLTEDDLATIMRAVDAELAYTYGSTRQTADRGQLGAVIVAECHNTRKRVADMVFDSAIKPAVKADEDLQRAMRVRDADL